MFGIFENRQLLITHLIHLIAQHFYILFVVAYQNNRFSFIP